MNKKKLFLYLSSRQSWQHWKNKSNESKKYLLVMIAGHFSKKSNTVGWLLGMIYQNQMRTSFSEGYGLSCLLKQTAKGRLEVCSCMKVSIYTRKRSRHRTLRGHQMPPHDHIVRKRMGRTQCCQHLKKKMDWTFFIVLKNRTFWNWVLTVRKFHDFSIA